MQNIFSFINMNYKTEKCFLPEFEYALFLINIES